MAQDMNFRVKNSEIRIEHFLEMKKELQVFRNGKETDGMNGFLLLIPFLIIRFGLLSYLNKDAVKRAAHFAPMSGNGVAAYWIYQVSNAVFFIYLFFLRVKIDFTWLFFAGMVFYILGLLLCVFSVMGFSSPSGEGLNSEGIYRFSRNPMYVSYFICFAGCAFLTQSLILGGIVFIFQISAHWIILSEERWCMESFGESYREYMKKVRRYI